MKIKNMQEDVHDWVLQNGGYWPPLSMMARLTEEVGELAREINHEYGMKKRKQEEQIKSISGEIGDILWTLICISNHLNINLEDTHSQTMDKLTKRYKTNTKDK